VLYAEPAADPIDLNGLELLAAVAGAAFPKPAAQAAGGAPFVQIGGAKPAVTPENWAAMPRAEQDVHLRAQRFARVHVAEMRLYQSSAVKEGRAARNLYQSLQAQIDAAREEYRRQFLEGSPQFADYLHQELVRTLANDDESMLGAGYPGALA
jgi:hypothetical protein